MFSWIGRVSYRWRWAIVAVWGVLLLATLPILPGLEEPLKVGGFSSPDTEAAQARVVLEEQLGSSPSQLVVIYQSPTLLATDPEFLRQVAASLVDVTSVRGVVDVVLPQQNRQFISADGTTAYAVVGLSLPPEDAQRDVPAFEAALVPQPDLTAIVAGAPVFYADIETVSQRDLRRAELIAFPFALIALLLVFGSVVAASVPLLVGGLSVAGVLLTLYWAAHVFDLSIFVLSLATMLGLGLAVDYSLFITSRYREELRRADGDVARAVERTMDTAGRAIFFSGLTVFIGLSGLTFFSFMFLRSVGVAGVLVVFFSVLAALTLLPAMLGIIGTRIDKGRVRKAKALDPSGETGFWVTLSHLVMKRPVMVMIPTFALLLLLGAPFIHVNVSSPDATILPKDLSSRQAFDMLTDKYGMGEISPFVVVVTSPSGMTDDANLRALYDTSAWLQGMPGIVRVQGAMGYGPGVTYDQARLFYDARAAGEQLGLETRLGDFVSEDASMILVYTDRYPNARENKALLGQIRSYAPGGDLSLMVTGGTAEIVDVVDVMYSDFPIAVGMILIATYVVLFLLFRSVVLPLKAILMNTLSILASYGALVFIFQDGHFSGLLRFEPLGFVEASLPVIMFCVLFGLSMDYQVFLLSRVREEWERTHDNAHSVAVGLQRSGRIITSAALIVVVVTTSFVSADVIIIKALGLGIALAVTVDATIIRALLVPSTMRLLGDWNWWMPEWLRRVIPDRVFIEEKL